MSNIELQQKITQIIAEYGSMIFMNASDKRLLEILEVAYDLKLLVSREDHPRVADKHRVTVRPNKVF